VVVGEGIKYRKYCNAECRMAAFKANGTKHRYDGVCPECGVRHGSNRKKYCGEFCAKRAERRNASKRRENDPELMASYREQRKKSRNKLRSNKRKAVQGMKVQCERCGYNKCPGALHFHHIENKEGLISQKSESWGKDRIHNEIKKCVVLCANCHAEVHCGVSHIDKLF